MRLLETEASPLSAVSLWYLLIPQHIASTPTPSDFAHIRSLSLLPAARRRSG